MSSEPPSHDRLEPPASDGEEPGSRPARSRAPRPSYVTLPGLDHPSHDGQPPALVLDYLDRRFPRVGRERWADRLRRGLVERVDGRPDPLEPLGPNAPYRPHARLAYFRELEAEPRIPYELEVLHEDERLVVVDKPPFLPVVPSGRFVNECVLYRLSRQPGMADLAPAHRLDRLTSGVVLLVRQPRHRGAYGELFARRQAEKLYEALGHLPAGEEGRGGERPARWRVENRIGKGRPFFRQRVVAGPVNAISEVELVERLAGETAVGRFRLRPLTGKTHQLRLHMAGLGFPILGDRLYPELRPELPDAEAPPLCLLAREIRFRDPIDGRERCFTSRRALPRPEAVDAVRGPGEVAGD